MNKLEDFLKLFKNKAKAYKSFLYINSKLGVFKDLYEFLDEIKQVLINCADPDQSFGYFERFLENTTAKSTLFEILKASKLSRELLFNIFSQSNTLSLFLIAHNEYFYWLLEDLNLKKNKAIFQEEINKLIKSKTCGR